ncbi:uncharacterized protein BO66DRAFT_146765 [Aspergillus aculeatinus CBS 121060]|uniref:Uncharacterized protein n=1 Tax=Aspergillus aculeatinus CBS 121060 TaxID=1448322 RepID=A0ACD1HKY4_9EURO|nr:hypothetical protein BO66DRAFT_146765 [Aspergillus aculeatinus CBS 121060]RAH74332.1 hypothetical protein BO66DRAFT_146765 [Aspergillus aculeatinus CBS 121060]
MIQVDECIIIITLHVPFFFRPSFTPLTHIIVPVPISCFVLLSENTHSTIPIKHALTQLVMSLCISLPIPSGILPLRSDLPFMYSGCPRLVNVSLQDGSSSIRSFTPIKCERHRTMTRKGRAGHEESSRGEINLPFHPPTLSCPFTHPPLHPCPPLIIEPSIDLNRFLMMNAWREVT